MEKSSLQNKILSEREKFDKKFTMLREEYERKNREEIEPLEQ